MGRNAARNHAGLSAREACGVFAAYSAKKSIDVAPMILRGLEALQHRGQESWGIAVPGREVFRQMGLAVQWTNFKDQLEDYKGRSGIGHVRYSTKGKTTIENAHPIQIGDEFSIAHNGTIVNAEELMTAIPRGTTTGKRCGTDTEAAGLRLLQLLRQERGNWFSAFERLAKEILGAYSFVMLTKTGEVYAARDPRGFRPLSLGLHRKTSTYVVASESCAITAVDGAFVRDVEPGELVRLGGRGKLLESHRFAPKIRPSYCSFEYTYFAHPSSRINGVSVYEARKRVGRILARKYGVKGDVVVPVPDSARPAALGYSVQSGIPMDEGLMKDRYRRKGSIRSFIEPRQGSRVDVVKQIIPIREAISNKRVVVVDDSVVRGTSSKIIVKALKRAGAKKVKMVVTFPPISHPCYMGVDFPSREELLAYQVAPGEADINKIETKVASRIGVDEFRYNDIDGLAKAIGLPKRSLCFSCINGDYSRVGITPASKRRRGGK